MRVPTWKQAAAAVFSSSSSDENDNRLETPTSTSMDAPTFTEVGGKIAAMRILTRERKVATAPSNSNSSSGSREATCDPEDTPKAAVAKGKENVHTGTNMGTSGQTGIWQ